MTRFLLVVITLICKTFFCIHTSKIDLIAETSHGKVLGAVRHALGSSRPVYSYFGIPYARSPDYAFRFHLPVNPWPWTDVKNTTSEKVPFCQQDIETMERLRENSIFSILIEENYPTTEDCLSVDVFTPIMPSKRNETESLPVIVWFHGGSYQVSATTHKMWMLSAFEEVVLVTVQYRLGVFGFLSFEDEWAPSNIGLHDQKKALEWVRDNILAFGGNPNLVTLFGLSAGGFSASAHSLSPLSKGLFHRVIAGSGVASIPGMWDNSLREKAIKVSMTANCKFKESSLASTCLRNRVTSSQMISAANLWNIKFKVGIDRYFFPRNVTELLATSSFNSSIPILIGGVAGEYDFVLARKIFNEVLGTNLNHSVARNIVKRALNHYYPEVNENPENVERLFMEYLPDKLTGTEIAHGVVDFLGDAMFNSHFNYVASTYKDAGTNVYFYNFVKKPSFYYNPKLQWKIPYDFKRADHSDDLLFFLGFPFLSGFQKKGIKFTNEESELSLKMMRMLATFAKSGVPYPEKSFQWPKYPSYVKINNTFSKEKYFRKRQMQLWDQLVFSNRKKYISVSNTCMTKHTC